MTDTHSILGEALEHHQAGRHVEASALYEQALEVDPNDPTALYLLGLLNFEMGHPQAALGLLRTVVGLRPDHVQARLTLANLLHWRGDYADAVEQFQAVTEAHPDNLAAQVGLAKALRDDGAFDAALAAGRAALDLDPNCAEAHEAMGGAFSGLGRTERAIDAYRAAIAAQPAMTTAHIGLALVLLAENRHAAALAAADAALAEDQNQAQGWFARGVALNGLRRLNEAVEALEQSVALDPTQAIVHLNLGNLYGEFERGEEAIQHLREALSLNPTLKEAHASLGSLYMLTGQKREAERFSWLALAIDPDMGVPHLNLASLMAERGEEQKARTHRDAAYRKQNVFVETSPAPHRQVLILSTAESGNVPFKFLLPRERYTRINWIVEYSDEGQAARLPDYDLVFNAVGDPDLAGPTQAWMDRFLAVCSKPVFNDPTSILRTFRHKIPELLDGVPGVVAPHTERLSAEMVAERGLEMAVTGAAPAWPVLIRPIGSHGGQGLIQIDSPGDLAKADTPRGRDLYVTPFHDYRSADRAWRKYRMIFVDRRPYPYHLAIADRWMVHHGTAAMEERPERLAEELRFLADPEAAIGAKAMAAVAGIGQRLDLDYAGVDFSVLADGSVLVFEANATMLVHPENADGPLGPKNPYVQRILDAFQAMIEARSGA